MKRLVAAVCIVALAFVGAACGDDDDALSEDEFLEQANAICQAGNDELDSAFEEAFPDQSAEPDTEQVVALFEDTLIPSVQSQIDDIRALDGPSDLEEDLDPVLDDAEQVLADLEDQLDEDPEAVLSADDPFAEINPRLEELGLSTCAEDD